MAFNPRTTDRQRYRNEALQADGLTAQELVAGNGIDITNNDGTVTFALAGDYATTVTAGLTTTLTGTSKTYQYFTGSLSQTIVLPRKEEIFVGWKVVIQNLSTGGELFVETATGGQVVAKVFRLGQALRFTCNSVAVDNDTAVWNVTNEAVTNTGPIYIGASGTNAYKSDNMVLIGKGVVSNGTAGETVMVGGGSTGSFDYAVLVGCAGQIQGNQSVGAGYGAQVGLRAVALGNGSSAVTDGSAVGFFSKCDTQGSLALGNYSDTSLIARCIVLNTNGTSYGPVGATNAFAMSLNTGSVAPGSLGMTLNGTARALEAYTSLFATTATAAGTTTLTDTSARYQVFTGTTTQTVRLPVVTTLRNGFQFEIISKSTGVVTIETSGAVTLVALAVSPDGIRGKVARCMVVDTTAGTGTASWTYELSA